MRSSSINNAQQLLSPELITKASKKSSQDLHDEAIRKVVTFDKHPPKVLGCFKPQPQGTRPHTSFGRCQDSSPSTKVLSSRKGPIANLPQSPARV